MQAVKRKIFTGARIVTLWDTMPQAEAVCVSNGRIEAVGSRAEIMAYAKAGPHEVVDLGGGVLYPGFIDTHSHLSSYSNCIDQVCCGGAASTPAAACEALRAKAVSSGTGEWILGYAYDDTLTPASRHLTRQDLDAVSADRPVFVSHVSLHFAYANSKALESLGLATGKEIPGGEVVMDSAGRPTGLLSENAAFYAFDRLPVPDAGQIADNIVKAVAEYNSKGFTSVIDGGIGFSGSPYPIMQAYTRLARESRLNARCYLQMVPKVMEDLLPYGLWSLSGDYLSFGGVKYFADGSIQGFTAALLDDYYTRAGFKGELLFPVDAIESLIRKYHSLDIQIAVHVNGDRAIETALAAFEKAVAEHPRTDLRHMLVHAQLASDEQLERMQACGIIPTLFSRHIEVWGDRHAAVFLGTERTRRMNPAGSCVRLGLPFGLHVDTPVLPVTALGGMHAAMNRISGGGTLLGPEQRISALEALKAYTTYAAMCCMGEEDRGRIEPGRFADFVLLAENLQDIAPDRVRDVEVNMTICGGEVVYQPRKERA